ncbi:MAG: ATP-dependent zinc metalloprotease FtsH [Flavipsychrobacter sp.]
MSTENNNTQKRKPRNTWIYWVLVIIMGNLLFTFFFSKGYNDIKETNWEDFKTNMLMQHDVEKADVINKERVEVYIKKSSLVKPQYKDVLLTKKPTSGTAPQYYFTIGSVEMFEKKMDDAQSNFAAKDKVPINYLTRESGWGNLLSWLLPIGLLLFLWLLYLGRTSILNRAGGAAMEFSKSRAQEYGSGNLSPITFKDVAGYEEAKVEVMEVVEFLKHPENFTKLGAKIPKGILLVGPPGTGKTLMAKAVAGEAAVPFFSLSGSEFIELFVGVGASRVRDLFDRAKEKAPSIIFIDEIDTIGRIRERAVSLQANDERESTLNQLLAEMDGFEPNTGVIVMAATNRADILDAALLRAGRFDRHIYLELPNKEERVAIFNVHLKPLQLADDVGPELLAAQTPGFSGADIANVCNEAALIAARQKQESVERKDFSDAIERLVMGIEKKTKVITPAEKKVIAYHEAGHALVSWKLKYVDPLIKVSIIPRGKSLGGAWYLPGEKQIITKAQFTDQLCATLGGRAAEEIIFNEISSGALDDLEKATKQAYTMVAKLGLNEVIGNVSFYDSTGTNDSAFQKPYSEATAQLIDKEVSKLIQEVYEHAKELLQQNKKPLSQIAELLLEKEVIYKEDIENIIGKKLRKKRLCLWLFSRAV